MKSSPTERQAALAARQLYYHRVRLRWIRGRMRENEDLLHCYLTSLDTDTVVLPGGLRIRGDASSTREISVEKLTPKHLHEQLALPVGQREIA